MRGLLSTDIHINVDAHADEQRMRHPLPFIDRQVAMKFVLDSKRSSSGKVLDGFVPEVRITPWAGLANLSRFRPFVTRNESTRIFHDNANHSVLCPEKMLTGVLKCRLYSRHTSIGHYYRRVFRRL